MTNLPDGLFVIGDQQRVLHWSYSAATMTGISQEAALGQPCHDLVRGCDYFGRAVCRPNCTAFKALRNGHLTGRRALLLPAAEGGSRRKIFCELAALPSIPGSAVATLIEQPLWSSWAPSDRAPHVATTRFSSAFAGNIVSDLAALATLSTSLSSERLEQSIEQALKWLSQAVDAEVAECFLVEPKNRDMLLTAFHGPFRNAFSQITRFHPGDGFPGLVSSREEPLVTQNLRADHRYLRTRVKDKGFLSYVCVPLSGPGGVMGTLNVAARRPNFDIERALRLLTWASRPISTVLQGGLLQNRERMSSASLGALLNPSRGMDGLLQAVLSQLILIGNATGGALALYDRQVGALVHLVKEGEVTAAVCPHPHAHEPQTCPALAHGRGEALYGPRNGWPLPCRDAPARGAVVYCLPLMVGSEGLGIVQLGYGGHAPYPPTKYLAALQNATEQAAAVLCQGWASLQNRERMVYLRGEEQPEPGIRVIQAKGQSAQPPRGREEAKLGRVRPFLEVHCLGQFQLYRQGELVTPDVFARRGALTLLKILLIHLGRRVPRDTLVELLWPEADPQAGANRLHVMVHTLRQVIEPSQQDQPLVYICRDGDRYYFNPDAPYYLDVEEFRGLVSLGEKLERGGDSVRAIEAYEAAAASYRGDLLEDEPYAEWCWGEREHLRLTNLDILQRLGALHAEQGALDRSIARYRQALRLEPLREENHRGLMRALWGAGRRGEALRQYQACREILCRELDVAPLPETEQLHSLIRANGEV